MPNTNCFTLEASFFMTKEKTKTRDVYEQREYTSLGCCLAKAFAEIMPKAAPAKVERGNSDRFKLWFSQIYSMPFMNASLHNNGRHDFLRFYFLAICHTLNWVRIKFFCRHVVGVKMFSKYRRKRIIFEIWCILTVVEFCFMKFDWFILISYRSFISIIDRMKFEWNLQFDLWISHGVLRLHVLIIKETKSFKSHHATCIKVAGSHRLYGGFN